MSFGIKKAYSNRGIFILAIFLSFCLYFLTELKLPEEEYAFQQAEAVALKMYKKKCPHDEINRMHSISNFKDNDHYDLSTEIWRSETRFSTISTFVYPSIKSVGLVFPNVDVIGININCGV